MDSPASTIFISYAREDSALALQIASALRAEGLPLWLDQLDIRPGERWDTAVEQALQRSGTLLVLLSTAAVASQNVMDEVSYGLDEGKRVLPLRVGEAALPLRLRRLQYVELASTEPQAVAAALQRVQGVLAAAPSPAPSPAMPAAAQPGPLPPAAAATPRGTLRLRRAAVAVVVLGLLGAGLLWLLRPAPFDAAAEAGQAAPAEPAGAVESSGGDNK